MNIEEEKDHYYLQTSYDGPPLMNYKEARRLIDNKLWTRDELRKLRGKTARNRDRAISNTLKQIHKPWHQRSVEDTVQHDGTILFDLT
tara:strand:+ start:4270 stop:4533 length:264 start_codon:yes stop_codon:yes gene_type:complete